MQISAEQKLHLLGIINNISKEEVHIWRFLDKTVQKTIYLLQETSKDNSPISYDEFHERMWEILNDLHKNTKDLNHYLLKKLQNFFRGMIFYYLSQSAIASRALSKPFGYNGDYMMMQTLYNNKPISNTTVGKYFDKFFLDDDLAKAVIDRVNVMGDRVIKFIEESDKRELNILNIASGPGFELGKVISNCYDKKIIYHCFDQEIASLSYIAQNFANKSKNIEIRLYKEDIRNFFKKWDNEAKFDFIYNIGLGDYMPDRVLISLINESLNNLEEGGTFILSHKDYTLFPYHHPSWLYNWNFIHRSLDEYKALVEPQSNVKHSVWFESQKKIIFFTEYNNSK